jgi:hypothetical protein
VLILRGIWDSPGVLAAGNTFAEALEHPTHMKWDPLPLDVDQWVHRVTLEDALTGLRRSARHDEATEPRPVSVSLDVPVSRDFL